jgi:hypothetical protein
MNPITVITEALQSLPPKLRKALYLLFALAVVGQVFVEEVLGHDTGKLSEVLLYIGPFIGFTGAANVAAKEPLPVEVVDGPKHRADEDDEERDYEDYRD